MPWQRAWNADPVRHHLEAAGNRLRFCLLLALALHAAVILGVGVAHRNATTYAPTLDVTLALQRDERADRDADFLAQFDQRGSGIEREVGDPAVPLTAAFDAVIVQPVDGAPPVTPAAPKVTPLLSAPRSEEAVDESLSDLPEPNDPVPLDAPGQAQPANEIATLIARLDARREAYAKMPRVERLTSAAAREAADAAYLYAWKQRVEAIGNEHYPVEAKRRRLYGELRLLVALRPDGSVIETRVLQSSGHVLLDNAAVQIVRVAAPFDAFPPPLAARADRLEIIRTWQFRANRLSAGD